MRKLAFLSVFILGGLMADASLAACSWEFGSFSSNANEYIYKTSSQKERVECDSSKCSHGSFFFAPSGHKFDGTVYNGSVLYKCAVEGSGDLWIAMDKSDFALCPGYTQTNCTQWYYMDISSGTATEVSGGGGYINVNNKSDICYHCVGDVQRNVKCKAHDGSTYANGHSLSIRCTESSLPISSGLSSTAHLVNDAVCTGTCETNGWNITLRNDSCDSTHEPDASKKNCVETDASRQQRQREEQQRRQRRENASKQEKCEESGGTWASNRCTCDAAKNLRLEAGECKCLDEVNYKRSADGKSCDLTDAAALQRKCEAAGSAGAVWDGTKCTCSDAKKIWNGSTCIANPNIANCEAIPGAKWSNGECKCKDEDKEMNEDGTECVETEEARKRREEARKQAEQDAAKARITSITGKLNSLKAGLSTSVWKNKEGNFNTSRLVSDSVAGVVLGTAGGLITSNVIKKNQIKGGFEDINCTVRGQVVAGYGDDFQVGIQ